MHYIIKGQSQFGGISSYPLSSHLDDYPCVLSSHNLLSKLNQSHGCVISTRYHIYESKSTNGLSFELPHGGLEEILYYQVMPKDIKLGEKIACTDLFFYF